MDQILINKLEESLSNRFRHKIQRLKLNIEYEDFIEIFRITGNYILKSRNENIDFLIDDSNIELIDIFYKWLVADDNSLVPLNKGILVAGSFGVGKSTILKSIKVIYETYTSHKVLYLNSINSIPFLKEKDHTFVGGQIVMIDEFGRNAEDISEYGNKINYLYDFLLSRYDSGLVTIAATNFNYETLENKFSGMLADRFKQMFFYYEMKGKSKRI